jgi:hypothetical protein
MCGNFSWNKLFSKNGLSEKRIPVVMSYVYINQAARRSSVTTARLPLPVRSVAGLVHSWQVERYLQKCSMFWDWLVKFFPQGIQVRFHSWPYTVKNELHSGMLRGDMTIGGPKQVTGFPGILLNSGSILSAGGVLTHRSEWRLSL